ncbi:MAG TPA: WbuC family cupin fold metalloprotein [Patescibacteria group bacterium]
MRLVDQKTINKLVEEAKDNPRHRLNFNFHKFEEPIQRMINVIFPDSYVIPHRHFEPDKLEVFIALIGEAYVAEFEDDGNLKNAAKISSNGPTFGVEIPPRIFHTIIPLSNPCVFYEIIEGPYIEKSHKKFAPWAPKDEKEGLNYIKNLTERVEAEMY